MKGNELKLFEQWARNRLRDETAMLFQIVANNTQPIEAIKMKFGHIEALQTVVQSLNALSSDGVEKFVKDFMPQLKIEEGEI